MTGGGLRAVFFFRRLFSLEVVLAGFRVYFRWAFLLSFLEGGCGFRRTAAGYVGVFFIFSEIASYNKLWVGNVSTVGRVIGCVCVRDSCPVRSVYTIAI